MSRSANSSLPPPSTAARAAAAATTLAAPNTASSPATVVLCVAGSIAAFKAVELARELRRAGMRVLPVMTDAAKRFVGPATLHALCGEPVRSDMFEAAGAGELHVELAAAADVVLVAPATADLLASFAHGRANDLVRATVLCARGPVVVAPAMHPRMWEHPATQRNVRTLVADGRATFVGPVHGVVANGEVGVGRMAEPAAIVAAVVAQLGGRGRPAVVASEPAHSPVHARLAGRHLVVTAGPTVEDVDPVRFLSNRSSGKMGFAVAARAAAHGARVSLIAGPVALATPPGVARTDVRSAEQMRAALWELLGPELGGADALVMAAAVADFRPAAPAATKLHRDPTGAGMRLELLPNPDLLAQIGAARRGPCPVCVGFALGAGSDEELLTRARAKLVAKQVDLIVANLADDAFDRDDNRVTLVGPAEAVALERMAKLDVADRLLEWIRARLDAAVPRSA